MHFFLQTDFSTFGIDWGGPVPSPTDDEPLKFLKPDAPLTQTDCNPYQDFTRHKMHQSMMLLTYLFVLLNMLTSLQHPM